MDGHLLGLIYFFLTVLLLVFCFLLCFIIQKKRQDNNNHLWKKDIESIISQTIFIEEEEQEFSKIANEYAILLKKADFRKVLINKLIATKKNLSGLANTNLKKLYEFLELDKDSLKKLKNKKGHIRAKGIQELANMEQSKYAPEIFLFINNADPLVRNEAQCGLVSFDGFAGLKFLDVVAFPVSNWQQIQLLDKLKNVQAEDCNALSQWMHSENESVVIFSIKLATFYNCYNVHDSILKNLCSSSHAVKYAALEYLRKMPQEETPEEIISQFHLADKKCKLIILEVLQDLGTEKHISFLIDKIQETDYDLRTAALKTLAIIQPSHIEVLRSQSNSFQNSSKEVFIHVGNERAA